MHLRGSFRAFRSTCLARVVFRRSCISSLNLPIRSIILACVSASFRGSPSSSRKCSKTAQVDDRGKDRYRRTLGTVRCAGMDANAEHVRRGMAWVYERYAPKVSPLYAVQSEARLAKRGLWQDARPVLPWE